jgi:hypothetical protein
MQYAIPACKLYLVLKIVIFTVLEIVFTAFWANVLYHSEILKFKKIECTNIIKTVHFSTIFSVYKILDSGKDFFFPQLNCFSTFSLYCNYFGVQFPIFGFWINNRCSEFCIRK